MSAAFEGPISPRTGQPYPGFTIEFDYQGKRWTDALAGLESFTRRMDESMDLMVPILKTGLKQYLMAAIRAAEKRHSRAWPGGTGEKRLSLRSGRLLQSLKEGVRVTGDSFAEVRGEIWGIFYARTQEFGAYIVPVRAQYLAIPLPAALDARGVPLKPGPRDWDRTFVITSKKGNLLIVQRLPNGRGIVPLYVLKKEVIIPPRLGIRESLESHKTYFTEVLMKKFLERLFGK